ncbi:hypothetical protein [Aeromonas salmonicida]|uniref:hypothetical protein n=1 Tax=Aeromonas salmonicida TaxID=645 RepID=UPI00201287AF|nr:hypothetical protein [Aeromonas salmonicida]
MEKENLVKLVVEYFEKVDAGDPGYLDLFSENVDFFFPKFGQAKGKDALVEFGNRIGSSLTSIWHDIFRFLRRYAAARKSLRGNIEIEKGAKAPFSMDDRWRTSTSVDQPPLP